MTKDKKDVVIDMIPELLKACKKSLKQIRNKHTADELYYNMVLINKQLEILKRTETK